MKLVFVTQVLDRGDAVLGFVCRWVEGLAHEVEELRVIALEVGDVTGLPSNVSVRELGRKGRIGRLLRYRGMLKEALRTDGFDTLLTHMVPRYSTLAAGQAQRYGAVHALWYTHKGVDERLRKAVRVVDRVFTASAESMRVDTPKKQVTGHGIDLAHFRPRAEPTPFERGEGPARLLSVGRLTPAKDPLCVLDAVAELVTHGHDVQLDWAGGGLAAGDQAFSDQVQEHVRKLGLEERVSFLGDVPYGEIPARFGEADLFLSASRTGSVDKVVLEAMACGVPAITCNESFPPIFAHLGEQHAMELIFPHGDAHALANCAGALLHCRAQERSDLGLDLRKIVQQDHDVDHLMKRLVHELERLRA
ncbi:MAG: glycosyltransferase involved in cell wall biosynthesis [Planctomycetota bacterium]|jgi:glycosyltransferase involved in cell wall biosynthesis